MHSINVVLRNLQEMIKSDKWGHGIFFFFFFFQDEVSCDIHYIINSKMECSKHTVASEISVNSYTFLCCVFEAGRRNIVFEAIIFKKLH